MDKLISRNFHNVPISLIRFTEKFLKLVDCVKCVLFLSVSEIISFWFKETKLWFLLLFFKFKFISTTIVHMAPFSKCIFKSRIFFQFFFSNVQSREEKIRFFRENGTTLLIAISLFFCKKKISAWFFNFTKRKAFWDFLLFFFLFKETSTVFNFNVFCIFLGINWVFQVKIGGIIPIPLVTTLDHLPR